MYVTFTTKMLGLSTDIPTISINIQVNNKNNVSLRLVRIKSSLFYELSWAIVKFFFFSESWLIQNILFIIFY